MKYDVFPVKQTKRPWDNWEEYYAQCPNSTGIQYFSRVGFNSKMDQALVEDGFNFPYMLAGRGYLVLLEKRNGSWSFINGTRTWVS